MVLKQRFNLVNCFSEMLPQNKRTGKELIFFKAYPLVEDRVKILNKCLEYFVHIHRHIFNTLTKDGLDYLFVSRLIDKMQYGAITVGLYKKGYVIDLKTYPEEESLSNRICAFETLIRKDYIEKVLDLSNLLALDDSIFYFEKPFERQETLILHQIILPLNIVKLCEQLATINCQHIKGRTLNKDYKRELSGAFAQIGCAGLFNTHPELEVKAKIELHKRMTIKHDGFRDYGQNTDIKGSLIDFPINSISDFNNAQKLKNGVAFSVDDNTTRMLDNTQYVHCFTCVLEDGTVQVTINGLIKHNEIPESSKKKRTVKNNQLFTSHTGSFITWIPTVRLT